MDPMNQSVQIVLTDFMKWSQELSSIDSGNSKLSCSSITSVAFFQLFWKFAQSNAVSLLRYV